MPDCISIKDSVQCQHEYDHTGKHYALTEVDGRKRSVKWSDDETTHLSLGSESIPANEAIDAARKLRALIQHTQNYAIARGIPLDQAEREVRAAARCAVPA